MVQDQCKAVNTLSWYCTFTCSQEQEIAILINVECLCLHCSFPFMPLSIFCTLVMTHNMSITFHIFKDTETGQVVRIGGR